jgi:hypothetical protein
MQDQSAPSNAEAQFAKWKQETEERLRALETAPRISNTSQRGGSFILLDDQGREVWTFGQYTRGAFTDYGILCQAPDGGPTNPTTLEVNTDGMEAPWIPLQVTRSSEFVVVTSGAYVNVWECTAGLLVSNAIEWASVVGCDAATTADCRLEIPGVKTSGVIACAAASFTSLIWSWLHEQNLGANMYVNLQVRRTSGAGNVNVYHPTVVSQAGGAGTSATINGL